MEVGGSPHDPVLTFDWTRYESVTAAVIDAVATASNSSPTDLDPLFEVVDPDALDTMFRPAPQTVLTGPMVEFPYNGMIIQVRATGEGRIIPQQ